MNQSYVPLSQDWPGWLVQHPANAPVRPTPPVNDTQGTSLISEHPATLPVTSTKSQTIPPVDVRIDPALDPSTGRANATFVVLARNRDISGIEASMKSIEEKFNQKHNYPWSFFNDAEFSQEFKDRVLKMTKADVQFGLVPPEYWSQPDWIDEDKAKLAREKMAHPQQGELPVPYARSVPYRNMCRYNSGVRSPLFINCR